ncbi:unnamed protein product [Dicrocoelium dendriticum]|nr:unnamed protein product [Dicrocoelium dendriticum]
MLIPGIFNLSNILFSSDLKDIIFSVKPDYGGTKLYITDTRSMTHDVSSMKKFYVHYNETHMIKTTDLQPKCKRILCISPCL